MRNGLELRVALAAAVGLLSFGSAAFLAACGGGSSPAGFGSGNDDAGAANPDDGSGSSGGGLTGDTSGGFGGVDSGPILQGACQPGTYAGQFTCNVTAFFDLFKLPWSGAMKITFVGGESQGNGEFATLTIASGAHISGTDQYQGAFSADLAGTLDCTSAKLTGSLNNAQYVYDGADGGDGGFAIAFSGALSSDYSGGSNPPSFPDGVMGPLVPGAADAGGGNPLTPAATCTWSASLQ